jgi:hypothetical protein
MEYWAGLYTESDKEQLIEGINTMLRVAKGIQSQVHVHHNSLFLSHMPMHSALYYLFDRS